MNAITHGFTLIVRASTYAKAVLVLALLLLSPKIGLCDSIRESLSKEISEILTLSEKISETNFIERVVNIDQCKFKLVVDYNRACRSADQISSTEFLVDLSSVGFVGEGEVHGATIVTFSRKPRIFGFNIFGDVKSRETIHFCGKAAQTREDNLNSFLSPQASTGEIGVKITNYIRDYC